MNTLRHHPTFRDGCGQSEKFRYRGDHSFGQWIACRVRSGSRTPGRCRQLARRPPLPRCVPAPAGNPQRGRHTAEAPGRSIWRVGRVQYPSEAFPERRSPVHRVHRAFDRNDYGPMPRGRATAFSAQDFPGHACRRPASAWMRLPGVPSGMYSPSLLLPGLLVLRPPAAEVRFADRGSGHGAKNHLPDGSSRPHHSTDQERAPDGPDRMQLHRPATLQVSARLGFWRIGEASPRESRLRHLPKKTAETEPGHPHIAPHAAVI